MFFENKKEKKEAAINAQETSEKTSAAQSFVDRRLPYNMENVMESLLGKLVSKEILSVNDAKQIMRSGESYLH
jgi:hypothetical protein